MPGIKYKGTDGQWHLLNNVMVAPINVVQTTGTSTADVMSQSAVTEAVSYLDETLTAHTSDGGIHLTSTEKTNLDSLETNIETISGITSTKVTSWDEAATNSHSHTNKTALDSITGNVGTMAYQATTSYSSATEVNSAFSNKVNNSTFTAHTASTTHMSTTEKTNLDSLETNIGTISGITSTDKLIHETMNRRTRTKFTNRDDFFANLRRAAADQNLERYGLKVGDYLNYNGHDYVIAGLNTMRGTRDTYRVTTDHVGLIVIPHTTQAWNISGNTYQSTYTYATSGGTWTTGAGAGYANSDLHHYMTETLLPIVNEDLGSSYSGGVLTHSKLYSNAVNTSGYNRFGSPGGCSSSWAWYANQKICALSEVQVYGSIVWSSSGYDTGEACRQLDVFRVYNMNEIFGNEYPWLRDVASSSYACYVNNYGNANFTSASTAYYVAALILFA